MRQVFCRQRSCVAVAALVCNWPDLEQKLNRRDRNIFEVRYDSDAFVVVQHILEFFTQIFTL